MISKVPISKKHILSNSLQIVKAMGDFSDVAVPSAKTIFDLMTSTENDDRFAGFQILAIFLEKGIEFFDPKDLNRILIQSLKKTEKTYVFEVIGSYLKFLKSKYLVSLYEDFVAGIVKKIKKEEIADSSLFIKAMQMIGKSDPTVILPYYRKEGIFDVVSMTKGKIKISALHCIQYNSKVIGNLWDELVPRGFLDCLKIR